MNIKTKISFYILFGCTLLNVFLIIKYFLYYINYKEYTLFIFNFLFLILLLLFLLGINYYEVKYNKHLKLLILVNLFIDITMFIVYGFTTVKYFFWIFGESGE